MQKSSPPLILLLFGSRVFAQTPIDMEFVPKGNIWTGFAYGYSSWKKYWQADSIQENGNVGTVSTQYVGWGASIGILDRLNLIVMLPYVWTNANSGTLNGQSGFQDIALNIKG